MIIQPIEGHTTEQHLKRLRSLKRIVLNSKPNPSGDEALEDIKESIKHYEKL